MAGVIFAEIGVSLFVAGAALGEILINSRSAKCCIFPYKMRVQGGMRKVSEAAGARWRFYPRLILGLSSDYPRIILELSFYWRKQFMEFPLKSGTCRFRGRRSIWRGWRVTLLAPRIGNNVSYVTRINHEIHFAWQAQYLVNLSCDVCCSVHCKWCFICDADQSWDSFCVAGAVFGELVVWRLMLRVL